MDKSSEIILPPEVCVYIIELKVKKNNYFKFLDNSNHFQSIKLQRTVNSFTSMYSMVCSVSSSIND